MKLSFDAPHVDCSNAIDWEIQQVTFDTVSDDDQDSETDRRTPYVLISSAFEVSRDPTIEWHDGNDYDGGASIRVALLERNKILITLDKSREIGITFNLTEKKLTELSKYLRNMLGQRLKTIQTNIRTDSSS
ncbi:MAG: hypothetical protein ACOYM3_27835 [Terrimicrobiaceae bacterium]